MSIHIARSFHTLAPMVLVTFALGTLDGCSKVDDDVAAAPNPTRQAQAVQASIASAQAEHDRHALAVMQDAGAAAPSAPMATGASTGDSPAMAMGASTGGAPAGMARMLGQPPMAGGSGPAGGLPPAMGAPHIYHLGADTFFLDQASAIGLTSDQQKKLAGLKDSAALGYATTQRKIEQGEQDLWALSSSEAPDIAKIETKIGDIARLTGQQRMDFIRTMGKAVGVLSDAQRKAVVLQGGPMQPGAMPPTPGASGMSMGDGGPPPSMGMGDPGKMPGGMGPGGKMPPPGMRMGDPGKMPGGMGPGGMPPPGLGMGGMADAGASGGMGHM